MCVGGRAGSRIIRLPRLLGEGPMMANPPRPSSIWSPYVSQRHGVGGWVKIMSKGSIRANTSGLREKRRRTDRGRKEK